jgi:hypothetical protein
VGRTGLRVGAAVAVAALMLAGACGVPASSGVIVDGVTQLQQPVGASPDGPDGPAGSTGSEDLIKRYLQAAAVGSVDTAVKAVQAFMTADAQRSWRPPTNITIVRTDGDPTPTSSSGAQAFTVDAEEVGLFDPATGIVDPPLPGPTKLSLKFEVGSDEPPNSKQERLSTVPPSLLLDDLNGLQKYFERHTVYFWDAGRTHLIAENRYLPRDISDAQKEAKIVNWVLRGASTSLQQTSMVWSPPSGVTLRDPTVATVNDRIVLNLSTGAHEVDNDTLRQLVVEIGWSFGPVLLTHPILLEIDDQPQFVMDPFLHDAAKFQSANPATLRGPAVQYAIADGVVHPVATWFQPQPEPLTSKLNTSVLVAAITADQRFAALVRPASGHRQGLWILRAGGDDPPQPVLTAKSIKFPSWVMGPLATDAETQPTLAVLVDGALTLLIDGTKQQVLQVSTPSAPLTSFAVSPEGSRIAMTIGGRLYTAVIVTQADHPTLSQPRELNIHPGAADVVAWRSEVELVFGVRHSDGHAVIYQAYTDGTNYDDIGRNHPIGTVPITQIAAYPSVGLTSNPTISAVLVQTGNQAYAIDRGLTPLLEWAKSPDVSTHALTSLINPFYAE